jgi:hypothetical protein
MLCRRRSPVKGSSKFVRLVVSCVNSTQVVADGVSRGAGSDLDRLCDDDFLSLKDEIMKAIKTET